MGGGADICFSLGIVAPFASGSFVEPQGEGGGGGKGNPPCRGCEKGMPSRRAAAAPPRGQRERSSAAEFASGRWHKSSLRRMRTKSIWSADSVLLAHAFV